MSQYGANQYKAMVAANEEAVNLLRDVDWRTHALMCNAVELLFRREVHRLVTAALYAGAAASPQGGASE